MNEKKKADEQKGKICDDVKAKCLQNSNIKKQASQGSKRFPHIFAQST